MKKRTVHYFVISAFTILYAITSLISTVHVVDFFALTNPQWLAISLAIAFEVGAAASLASIIALEKMNKAIVWMLFITLTAMQAMGNTYYAYVHAANFQDWIELFGLVDEEFIYQKRILGLISGGILPIVALGYIKALIDYVKPENQSEIPTEEKKSEEFEPVESNKVLTEIDRSTPTSETITTTLPDQITEISTPIEVDQIVEKSIETTEPPTTTESPRLNSIEETTVHTKTIDERLARGEQIPVPNLRRPHDP
jgi:hypothetical protein